MATPNPNPLLLSLISLFSLFLLAFSSKLTIPLSPLSTHPSSSDPIQTLNLLSSASLSRAHHLKRHPNSSTTNVPLNPRSYGGYSIPLSFGTPPQTSTFVMDTGSSLVWFPCTSRYVCSRCSFPNIDPSHIPAFIPKLSSSSRIVGCKNPKCAWVFGPEINTKCPNSSQACPTYVIQYGSGTTAGKLLSESLDFPDKVVPNFFVGCSFLSIRQPAGIAGFGRGPQSLPAQMGLSKFSYCLVSRRFDDTPVSSDLVLSTGNDDGADDISYTPFQKNPGAANTAYREYYYLLLRRVIVGKKPVKIPYKYLVPGEDDNGGTIVDSGSTFTFMERPVFEAVAEAFAAQMEKYTRARDIENRTGLKPCFDISKEDKVDFPELVFQFKGGAKMALPLNNYFALVTSDGVVCLTIVTDGAAGPGVAAGPAVILGSFQQQNFYVEYDLERERFGFRKQNCKK
ncbi:probable aspartyl protease At4g16563 [Argentina anserina]|uniref:probable aspartyl protease At4g16563 n=1 Tax=Argentina anserina TaxID=57926 RepID=UPI00217684A6|nr:probable aspartyl protease At4g16563 [Potentilla anserina]